MSWFKYILSGLVLILTLSLVVGLVWICVDTSVKYGLPLALLIVPLYVALIVGVIFLFGWVLEEIEFL